MKTVILSSKNRVLGQEADCFVEIKEGILQSHKKYACKLKWIHFAKPTLYAPMKTIFMVIDGINYVDTYSNMDITPFACIDTTAWKDVADSTILFEPHDHVRTVQVRQNVLRVKLYNADNFVAIDPYTGGNDSSLGDDWTMELHFVELKD